MIVANAAAAFDRLAAALVRKAGLLAEARAAAVTPGRRNDPFRWRHADLVWPLFGKGEP